MDVLIVGIAKEGIETDAKKQRRNYKVVMISDQKGGWIQRCSFRSATRARLE